MSGPGAIARIGAGRAARRALVRALPVLFCARMVGLIMLPLFGIALLWVVIGVFAWHPFTAWLAGRLGGADPGTFSTLSASVIALLALVAAILVSGLLIVAVVAMPGIVRIVAARDFPVLQRRRGGTLIGSIGNAVLALVVFVPAWIATLFLLPLPLLYLAISLALNAWLNQRLFRYDALAEHADRIELAHVVDALRGRLFLLGLLLAPLALIPLVNLVAPLYAGIAFTYLCLDELARERAAKEPDAMP